MKKLLISILALFATNCAHSIHGVHTNSFDQTPGSKAPVMITSKAQQQTILGFVFDSNYVEEARWNLQKKCPNGRVEGITTQLSTSLGFLYWTNKILMKGLCYQQDNAS